VSFWGTIWSSGLRSASKRCLVPVPRPNIERSLMLWLKYHGSGNYSRSFISVPAVPMWCCDNISTVYLSTNPVQHQRSKHVEIDLHFLRDKVAIGEIRVLHVPSTSQYADVFTKGLPTSIFIEFRSNLNVSTPG
jgi:hypothetical protein